MMDKWRKAVLGTLGAIGIWIAAVVAVQPNVPAVPLPLKQIGDARWVTVTAYTTTIATITVIIPAGFTNDLASIPRPAQEAIGITRNHPSIRRGALVHDWLYHSKEWNKEAVDLLLYYACIEDGMDRKKAMAVLKSVQLWGFIAWDRK